MMTSNNSLVLKRTFPGSCEELFTMWTKDERLKQWFAPGKEMTIPVAECDAREGGTYRIVMQNADGGTHSPSGVYEKVVANELLVFSWKWADSELKTRVRVEFRALGDDETELTLTHEGFPDPEMKDKHEQGWTGCFARLAETLQLQT